MNTFSAVAMIRAGWEIFKKRPWFFVGAFLVLGIVSGISSSVTKQTGASPNVLLAIINFVVQTFVYMGMYSVALKAHDNATGVSFGALWHPQSFLSYFAASIVTGIIIVVGFILLIIPGVVALIVLMFVPYFVIDKGQGPIQAIKSSIATAKGHWFDLFVLLVLVIAINILGLIALLIGVLVSAPVSMLAVAHAYRTLSGHASTTSSTAATL